SHANGAHLNLVVTGLIPFIVWYLLRLRQPGTVLRAGIPLGLLVAVQIFIGEELLLLTGIGLVLLSAGYAVSRPRPARLAAKHVLAGLAVAGGIALALTGYPLWWQFTGPASYSGLEAASTTTNDVLAIGTLPSQSLFGDQASTAKFVQFHNEEDAFFGL